MVDNWHPWSTYEYHYQAWVTDWYLLEVAASLISCSLTALLCVVLWIYDQKQAPTFRIGSGITLSTIVALLVTLSVAAALKAIQEGISQLKWTRYLDKSYPLSDIKVYDEASRGFVGSLRLLWRLRLVRSWIASLGALLLVVQLAIVPLAQQTVQLDLRRVIDPHGEAHFPLSNYVNEDLTQEKIGTLPANYQSLGAALRGAISSGIFSPPSMRINETAAICSSGNCTFEPVSYLATCRNIRDVSYLLKQGRPTSGGFPVWCVPNTGICLDDHEIETDGTRMPWDMAILTSAAPFAEDDHLASIIQDPTNINNGSLYSSTAESVSLNFTSLAFADHTTSLADMYVLHRNSLPNTNPIYKGRTVNAIEINIDWCEWRSSISVENGQTHVTRINTTRIDLEPYDDDGTPYLRGRVGPDLYTIRKSTHDSLQRYLQQLFNGSLIDPQKMDIGPVASTEVSAIVFEQLGLLTDGSGWPERHYNYSQLEAWSSNLVTSITNWMRSSGYNAADSTSNPTGIAYTSQVVVQVNWGWVAAPACFSLMSFLFLALVVLRGWKINWRSSTSHRPPVWKSSNIALLHALDFDDHPKQRGMMKATEMNVRAESLNVQLIRTNGLWRLVESHLRKS